MAGDDCVKQQDVHHLDGFHSVSGISLRKFRLQLNLDEQTTHEGVNISTQFVTKTGERLQEDEHILADDSSGHATLLIVQKDWSDNVDKVDNSLALCLSCYKLVCAKNVPTKELGSLANGSETNEDSDLARAHLLSLDPCTTSTSSNR